MIRRLVSRSPGNQTRGAQVVEVEVAAARTGMDDDTLASITDSLGYLSTQFDCFRLNIPAQPTAILPIPLFYLIEIFRRFPRRNQSFGRNIVRNFYPGQSFEKPASC